MSDRAGGASVTVDSVAERIASARLNKAVALAAVIRHSALLAAKSLTSEEWTELARLAEVNPPSPTTTALVLRILESGL